MAEITTTEARTAFSDILNRAAFGKERVVLTRRGRRLVAVVPVEDLELIERLEDQIDQKAIREAWAEQGDEPPSDLGEVRRRLGAEKRATRPAPRGRSSPRKASAKK